MAAAPDTERPGAIEITYKIVQAVLATLAVYRGARAALNQWKGVIAMVRGPAVEAEDEA